MFIVRQSPQQVQLDLLGGWILFLQCLLEQALEVAGLYAVLEFPGVAVNTPLPYLGAVLVWNACSDKVLQLRRTYHLPVHCACKIVFPLDPSRNFLIFCEVQSLQVQCSDLGDQLLFLVVIRDSPKPIDVKLTVDK